MNWIRYLNKEDQEIDGTGVGDNVVNQLLSKMDGVDQLNIFGDWYD